MHRVVLERELRGWGEATEMMRVHSPLGYKSTTYEAALMKAGRVLIRTRGREGSACWARRMSRSRRNGAAAGNESPKK